MKTWIRISPFLLVIIGLSIYNYVISSEALHGDSEGMRRRFIMLEIIIPFVGSLAALQFEKARRNRFIFGMFGFFAGFLISLDLFVVAMIRG
ncbi:hypothetical protein [Aneurinibacillus aneurinilyticus]|uniref:Uncharacterized protein n=2 Tax=Aneurinibacillus aneurinilyticus TaxID=1391 RepID=A0A848CHG1_ANEAE|nr:hypothetical protein [Aneurinibacillus aneurinilyticus]ERI09976.1 hypothetical protein HMPREF0083_01905 [Aneurinibacillus aneurinilyticus ATCC 12856]MCI1692568.1 hypothetical protein [Aneurinibacillus aneurinilyticus]MED0670236.1 hypothetical protein [Aneurinibacillus aneurinilyticus]MED0705172.1 hypothetical protein [Aneurinibacillus aneurinilyticus]MED0725668.1 hypothetical protein [Aneurinibacillus aneurinilyticus]